MSGTILSECSAFSVRKDVNNENMRKKQKNEKNDDSSITNIKKQTNNATATRAVAKHRDSLKKDKNKQTKSKQIR